MAARKAVRADGAQRRETILAAAEQVFAERGPFGASLEEVRVRAGASPSSMYHHFGGLEAITLALLERTFARLFAHLSARVTPTKSARACVEALVRAHLEWVLAHRREARVMYQLMSLELSPRVSVPLARRKAALLAPVVEHFAGFVARGELPPLTPLEFDVLLLGTAHEACRRLLGGAPLDARWLEATLPGLAWPVMAARLRSARANSVRRSARRS